MKNSVVLNLNAVQRQNRSLQVKKILFIKNVIKTSYSIVRNEVSKHIEKWL